MIRVAPASEPASFDGKVRRRGLDAIAELVGEAPSRTRRGPGRQRSFASRDQIAAAAFPPFWRDALPDLRDAYCGLCAYLALYIEHGTGAPSIDHFVPKSKDWRMVYEWSNYRLCSSLINGHRGDRAIAHDPFLLEAGLFALEFTEHQVIPGLLARGRTSDAVMRTIDNLGLNQRDCRKAREEYVAAYRMARRRASHFPGSNAVRRSSPRSSAARGCWSAEISEPDRTVGGALCRRIRRVASCRRCRVLLASRRWRLSRWFRSVTR